jgi:hypothetical protein
VNIDQRLPFILETCDCGDYKIVEQKGVCSSMCGFIGIVVFTCEMKQQLENLWVWEVASTGTTLN